MVLQLLRNEDCIYDMGLGASSHALEVYAEQGFTGFVARRDQTVASAHWTWIALLDEDGRAHRVHGQGVYDLVGCPASDRVVRWGSFAGQQLWLRRIRVNADASVDFMLSHGRWSRSCVDDKVYVNNDRVVVSSTFEVDAGTGYKLLSFRADSVGQRVDVSNVLTQRVEALPILQLASAVGGFRGIIVDATTRTQFWGLVDSGGKRYFATWAHPANAAVLEGPAPWSRLVALRLALDQVHCSFDSTNTTRLCLPPPFVSSCRHEDESGAAFSRMVSLEYDGKCELTSVALELDQALGLYATVCIFSPPVVRDHQQMPQVTTLTIHPSIHSASGFWGYQMYPSGSFAGLLGEGSVGDPTCRQVRFQQDGLLLAVRANAAQKFIELITTREEKIHLTFLADHACGKVARIDHVVQVVVSAPLVITKFGITFVDSTKRDVSIFMVQDHAAAPRMSGLDHSSSSCSDDAAALSHRPSNWVYFGLFLIVVAVLGMLAVGWHTTRRQKRHHKAPAEAATA